MECGAAVINGCIYVTGGYSYSKGTYLESIERYDPELDCWEIVGSLPSATRSHGCVGVFCLQIYCSCLYTCVYYICIYIKDLTSNMYDRESCVCRVCPDMLFHILDLVSKTVEGDNIHFFKKLYVNPVTDLFCESCYMYIPTFNDLLTRAKLYTASKFSHIFIITHNSSIFIEFILKKRMKERRHGLRE